jgi:GT2 family glycosyltransferase
LPTDLPADALAPPEVSIVVPVHGAYAHTRMCLASIRAHGRDVALEAVVVDDASRDDTAARLTEWAARWPALRVITNETNRGFARSANRGVAESKAPIVVVLNNDTVVPEGALARLARLVRGDPSLGLVGAVSNDSGADASIPAAYDSLAAFRAFAARQADLRGDEIEDHARLSLFCAALRKETWDRMGGLDEDFGPGGFEDDDLCMRLRHAGLRVVVAPGVFVHHAGGATLRKVPPGDYVHAFESARLRFERKWGVRWRPP